MHRSLLLASAATVLLAAGVATAATSGVTAPGSGSGPQDAARTATPIKHVVIIFNENVSFDHYFATYPDAANPPGEPRFVSAHGTPRVERLANANLLEAEPEHQSGKRRRCRAAVPPGSHAAQHGRPEPRLYRGATSF